MALTFDEEILEWTLDQDSVQTLLCVAAERWGLSEEKALDRIIVFASDGILGFYEDLPEHRGTADVSITELTIDYLKKKTYVWLAVTPLTIPKLNEIRKNRK